MPTCVTSRPLHTHTHRHTVRIKLPCTYTCGGLQAPECLQTHVISWPGSANIGLYCERICACVWVRACACIDVFGCDCVCFCKISVTSWLVVWNMCSNTLCHNYLRPTYFLLLAAGKNCVTSVWCASSLLLQNSLSAVSFSNNISSTRMFRSNVLPACNRRQTLVFFAWKLDAPLPVPCTAHWYWIQRFKVLKHRHNSPGTLNLSGSGNLTVTSLLQKQKGEKKKDAARR